MRGRFIVGISAANRTASGIAEGDAVQVELQLDAKTPQTRQRRIARVITTMRGGSA
jgi:Domain of unknown function (DUF1905)